MAFGAERPAHHHDEHLDARLEIGRAEREEGTGVEGTSGYGKGGWEGKGRMYTTIRGGPQAPLVFAILFAAVHYALPSC